MSTVILLSSSPPPVFAPSPTPVRSSSPLPSTAALIHGNNSGRRKFKTKDAPRDGFSSSFSTARQVLAEKSSAKNTIITSPRRFRSSAEKVEVMKSGPQVKRDIHPVQLSEASATKLTALPQVVAPVGSGSDAVNSNAEDVTTHKQDSRAPLLLDRAVPRKLDWTPSKQKPGAKDEKSVEYSAGFMNGMLNNYTYLNENAPVLLPQHAQAVNPAKRRRLEPARSNSTGVDRLASTPKLTKAVSAPTKPASKRNKSPAKKPLTITGLATSNYSGHEEVTETPLMQYLTLTQAQLNTDESDPLLETKVRKTKAAVSKLKSTGKKQSKSLLLSPKSAMKSHYEQDPIFGSASQLAREESPTFLRETIEAMKQSESFLLSDPISSPQRTQNLSIENTPQAGIARFRRTRNLWAAAGRDEDNALLHIDTVDLTDTPAVRAAFAGKDVMLQPHACRATSPNRSGPSLRGGYSPLAGKHTSAVIDIGDIDSLGVNQVRALHTATGNQSPRRSPRSAPKERDEVDLPAAKPSAETKEPPPPKPNYTGLSIHDLNKQIKSYGFKAMRKREKMIELLDRCWEEKYGTVENVPTSEPNVVPFGDYLSKVHDLSARPEPKVKKPRGRKKKDDSVQKSKDPIEKPAKKPRQRKKIEDENDTPKPKVTRKRKSAKGVGLNDAVFDIDAIVATIPEELKALEAFEDWAKPERKPKAKPRSKPTAKVDTDTEIPPTPPPTLPLVSASTLEGPVEDSDVSKSVNNLSDSTSLPAPTSTPSQASISTQITAAILHQTKTSSPERDHNINPTWHEKILLYDPIILEDLASWLNTEGLGAISDDREVSALEVREWCESKGVCCLWRGGWRGNKLAQ